MEANAVESTAGVAAALNDDWRHHDAAPHIDLAGLRTGLAALRHDDDCRLRSRPRGGGIPILLLLALPLPLQLSESGRNDV